MIVAFVMIVALIHISYHWQGELIQLHSLGVIKVKTNLLPFLVSQPTDVPARVRRFRQKKFFASKRNEAKRDPFRTLTWKKLNFFSLLFASNFSLPTKVKLIVLFFALFRLQKFFVSLPIFSFRFKAKRNKRFFTSFHHTRYRHKKVKDQPSNFSSILYKLSQNFTLSFFALKFLLLFLFVFISFQFFALKRKKFTSISLWSENDSSFLLPFRFISLQSENDGSFLLFFVLFSLRSIFVSLQISSFRIDAKQAKKTLFFASKRKKFRFRFASFRFEAKMTAHPSTNLSVLITHTG